MLSKNDPFHINSWALVKPILNVKIEKNLKIGKIDLQINFPRTSQKIGDKLTLQYC